MRRFLPSFVILLALTVLVPLFLPQLDVERWTLNVGRCFFLLFFLGVLFSPFSRSIFAVNPALPATYNSDGTVVFGGQTLSIPTAAAGASPQDFITDGFTLTLDSDWTEQNNSAARPSKQMGRPKIPMAEIELQYTAGATAAPYLFAEFTASASVLGNPATITLIVSKVGLAAKNDGGATKISISARWKLN